MKFVGCSVPERFVNPLFEVFDGGDFALSSYRDVEEDLAQLRIYLEDGSESSVAAARSLLASALETVGAEAKVETGEIADDDWKFAYRRHFKIEPVGANLLIVPAWEADRKRIVIDPGLAFGTGRHETTRACLEYIDELFGSGACRKSFLDMGCGSGILSIAAAKLGASVSSGFDIDPVAVEAAEANAEANGVAVSYRRFALGKRSADLPDILSRGKYDVVAANILGPLLIKFVDEIVPFVGESLIISGILSEAYEEVLAAYSLRGLEECSRKTVGEWTTGLLSFK